MKTMILRKWSLGLACAVLPFLGCGQKSESAEPIVVQNATPIVGPATQSNLPATDAEEAEPAGPLLEDAAAEMVAPPAIPAESLAPAAAEIVKLAQAGVDESVMMAFVTNSSNVFRLTSDNLVYLNDVGVPAAVVTAMLQRDQAAGAAAQPVVVPETNSIQTAAAPIPYAAPEPQPAPAAAPTAPVVEAPVNSQVNVSYTYFYDSLAPYGSWISVDGYGLCWRPTVVAVDAGWQPYVNRGRWMYTDVGWYWASDYSWGWAPFHYGRWFRHSRWGWCWAPDTVWGPAWVSWRYTPDYCGWAPLPPAAYYRPGYGFTYYGRSVGFSFSFGLSASHYCFVPTRHFHDRHFHRHRLPHDRVTHFYHNTRPMHRYDRDDRNRIVNRGIPVEHVSAASRTDIRPVRIRETDRPTPARLERGGARNASPQLAVYRPELPQPERPGRLVGEGVRPAPVRSQLRGNGSSGAPITRVETPAARGAQRTPPAVVRSGTRDERALPRRNQAEPPAATPNTPAVATPRPDRDATPRAVTREQPRVQRGEPLILRGNRPQQGGPAATAPESGTPAATPNTVSPPPVRPQAPAWTPRMRTEAPRVQTPAAPAANQNTPGPTVTTPMAPPVARSPVVRELPGRNANSGTVIRQPAPRPVPEVRTTQPAPAPVVRQPPMTRQTAPRIEAPRQAAPRVYAPAPQPRSVEVPRMVAPRNVAPPPRAMDPAPQMRQAPRVEAPQPRTPAPQPRSAPAPRQGNRPEPRGNR